MARPCFGVCKGGEAARAAGFSTLYSRDIRCLTAQRTYLSPNAHCPCRHLQRQRETGVAGVNIEIRKKKAPFGTAVHTLYGHLVMLLNDRCSNACSMVGTYERRFWLLKTQNMAEKPTYLLHSRVLKKTLLALPPLADSASMCVSCGFTTVGGIGAIWGIPAIEGIIIIPGIGYCGKPCGIIMPPGGICKKTG
jgi:hypothetical protein